MGERWVFLVLKDKEAEAEGDLACSLHSEHSMRRCLLGLALVVGVGADAQTQSLLALVNASYDGDSLSTTVAPTLLQNGTCYKTHVDDALGGGGGSGSTVGATIAIIGKNSAWRASMSELTSAVPVCSLCDLQHRVTTYYCNLLL